jgi:hypothetical protein
MMVSILAGNVSADEIGKQRNEEGNMKVPVYQFLAGFDFPSMQQVISRKYISTNIPKNAQWIPNNYGMAHEIKITKVAPPYVYAETTFYSYVGVNRHSYKFEVRKEDNNYYLVPSKNAYQSGMLFVEPWVEAKTLQ